LKIEIACNQWEGATSIQASQLFNLGFEGRGKGGRWERFFFHELLMCSYYVPKFFPKFSMCSSRVFSIAPNIKPICFAQNLPLFTYIVGVFITRGNNPGKKNMMNPFEERNFIQPMGSAIMLSGCLGFFPFKFWV
jgi:hypothetical protein